VAAVDRELDLPEVPTHGLEEDKPIKEKKQEKVLELAD
jgi:hypothetical protein